jgi:type II restriction enzyme
VLKIESDWREVFLSPGINNQLQAAIIEEFGPRFAPGATLLYAGDTALKRAIFDARQLSHLSIPVTELDKLPDIILYWPERNWLFLIEPVTSHGPVSPKRYREIEEMLKGCRRVGFISLRFLRFELSENASAT